MQTVLNQATDSLVNPRHFYDFSWMARLTIRTWTKFWNTLETTQGRRYRMLNEELLRSPLSNEARRMSWH